MIWIVPAPPLVVSAIGVAVAVTIPSNRMLLPVVVMPPPSEIDVVPVSLTAPVAMTEVFWITDAPDAVKQPKATPVPRP